MKLVRLLVAVAAMFVGGAVMAQTGEPAAEVVIRGIAVVDVEAGRLLPARDIVVRGTRIESVRPAGGALPRAKTVIDGRGKVAVPGLIDTPLRLVSFGRDRLQGLLSAGITAVRDAGSDTALLQQWRRDLDDGRLWAPRIVEPCGPAAAAVPPSAAQRSPAALHDELVRLVAADGKTPAQALRAATLDRARAWCLDGLGTIAAGAAADVVVLTANPLDDVRHLREIDAVVFRGGVLTYAHLQVLRRHELPAPTPPR